MTPEVPVLTDGTVTLRALTLDDVPGIVEQCNDPVSIRWTTVPVPYTDKHAADWVTNAVPAGWSAGRDLCFGIEYDGRFAGSGSLRPDPDGNAEIAYGLGPPARGHGVAHRAVSLLLDWGFGDNGFPVVHWRANVGNWASRRVAWAAGFRFGPTIPKLLEQRGERYDAWTGWLGADDPREPRTRWLTVPELTAGPYRLRPWRDDELERIASARTNEPTAHFLPYVTQPYEIADARWLLDHTRFEASLGRRLNWCVADAETDLGLANLTLFHLDDADGSGEIGYWAHPDGQGRGVVSAALREVARWTLGPDGPGVHRLVIRTAGTNKPARAVAEAAGFRHSGTERASYLLGDGTHDDTAVYDLLRSDL
jgi:RimJ/RimL family protein N-acetyltransferase